MAPIGAKLRQNAFRTICNFRFLTPKKFFRIFFSDFLDSDIGFSSFSVDFGGARLFLTSKSSSWRHFAADGRVLRPVRGLEAVTRSSSPKKTERAGPSYARFLVFLEAWILSGLKDCIALRLENVLLHALRPEASAD